jgi:FG-GAP repeat protein
MSINGWNSRIFCALLCLCPLTASAQLPHPLSLGDVGVGSVDGVRINGIDRHDRSGHDISGVGDFNGDGIEDFIVNGIIADPHGIDRAGEAYLILGSDSGMGTAGVLKLIDLDGVNGTAVWGNQDFGQLGASVAGAGDVNGDGFSDALITANRQDVSGAVDSGLVLLMLGGETLPGAGGVLELADFDDSIGVRIPGIEAYDFLAQAAGAGDVNADGIDDFALASFWANVGAAHTGEVYLIYGSTSGIGVGGELDLSTLDGTNGVRFPGLGADYTQGSISGIGDFNGDGIDDLVIAAHLAPSGDETASGEAYLVFGSRDKMGDGGVFDLASLDGENGVRILGGQEGERLGAPLRGTGDVNGDGFADLAIPTIYATVSGREGAGRTYLLWGSRSGLGQDGVLRLADLDPAVGIRIEGVLPDSNAGYDAGGAGDINGDGFADLLIGTESADPYSLQRPGESYTVFGSPSGIGTAGALYLGALDGENGIVHHGYHEGDATGRGAGAAGDVNGDGISDYLIGSYWADAPATEAGRTALIFGQSDVLAATHRRWLPSGEAHLKGVGMIGDGSHSIPFSRCWIGFSAGEGPGVDGASLQTVTLVRSGAQFVPSSPDLNCTVLRFADVMWQVETDRDSYQAMQVRFHYLDSEITGMDESSLRLIGAPTPTGPWQMVAAQQLRTERNEIAGVVPCVCDGSIHFALIEASEVQPPPVADIVECLLGMAPAQWFFDTNGDGVIDTADVVRVTEPPQP